MTKKKFIYAYKIVLIDIALCFYVYFLLREIDHRLESVIIGYQPTESYFLATSIFFVASLVFFYLSMRFRWYSLLPYLFLALSVFFPLVVISTVLHVKAGLTEHSNLALIAEFCSKKNEGLCGEGFSHLVFSMTIRALPVVLTVPVIYWLALKFLKLDDPKVVMDV